MLQMLHASKLHDTPLIHIMELPVRIVSVSELKESTFVIPRANLVMDVFLLCATQTTVSCSDDDSIQEC